MNSRTFEPLLVRPYQINLVFRGSADSVFMRNKKKYNLSSSASTSNLGARLCGYGYVVSLAESIATWPCTVEHGSFFPCRRNKGSLVAQASVYLLFPLGPWSSWAANFPLSFGTESSCFAPCSSSHDPVSISKSSSFVNVSAYLCRLITVRTLHLRLPHLVPPSPYYCCRRSCSLPKCSL